MIKILLSILLPVVVFQYYFILKKSKYYSIDRDGETLLTIVTLYIPFIILIIFGGFKLDIYTAALLFLSVMSIMTAIASVLIPVVSNYLSKTPPIIAPPKSNISVLSGIVSIVGFISSVLGIVSFILDHLSR
jgi:hypothetical protein